MAEKQGIIGKGMDFQSFRRDIGRVNGWNETRSSDEDTIYTLLGRRRKGDKKLPLLIGLASVLCGFSS